MAKLQKTTVDEIEQSLSGKTKPMIQIKAPDGTIVKFPDGTTDAVIERVMRENYGGPALADPDNLHLKAIARRRRDEAEGKGDSQMNPAPESGNGLMSALESINEWLGGSNLPPEQRTPGKIQSAVSGVGNTLSFGLSDELMSAAMAPLRGKTYDDQLSETRLIQDKEQQTNPKTYLAGQITGAALPAAMTMGNSIAPSLAANTLRGGVIGGAQAGVYGFGEGEGGFENRIQNAGTNAVMGTAFGSSAPVIARGIGAGWNGVASALANRGIPAKAQNVILDMLQKTGLSPDDAVAKLEELGPEGMLADVAQIEAAGTARAASGAGKVMGDRLAMRRESGGQRVNETLDEVFGPAQDPYAIREATIAAKSDINPAYREAIANAPQLPKTTAEAMAKGLTFPAKGLSMENRAIMGRYMSSIDDALIADTPQLTASRLLDLRKSLDSQIVYGPREQMMLAPADRATQDVIKQARAHVDQILKKFIPGIKEADAAHAPLSRQQSAFDYGRKDVLRGGTNAVTPAELTARFADMTPSERAMINQGVRAELSRMLANTRNNPATTVDRVTSRDWNRDKIQTLLGDGKTDKLKNTIDRESVFNETSNLIEPSRNSRTAVLSEAVKRWKPDAQSGSWGDIATAFMGGSAAGGWPAGAAAAAGVGTKRIAKALLSGGNAVDDKLAGATADYLSRNGAARDKIIEALLSRSNRQAGRERTAQSMEQIIRALLGSQSGMTAEKTHRSFRPLRPSLLQIEN